MKNLTKWLLIATMSIFVIISCEDNNPNEPEDNDETNGGGVVTSISGKIWSWQLQDGYKIKLEVYNDTKETFVAGESSISTDGSFNISTLQEVPANFLFPVTNVFPADSVTISNQDAKFCYHSTDFTIYNSSDVVYGHVEYAWYGASDNEFTNGSYLYSDSDVSITGSFTQYNSPVTVNVNLKKGWNIIYEIAKFENNIYVVTITTETQEGLDWYY